MIRTSQMPITGTRNQRDGGGLIKRSTTGSPDTGRSQGEGAGRVLRATAAMRIAATGNTMAVGPAAGLAPGSAADRTDRRLA
jgi:hypothetical protein